MSTRPFSTTSCNLLFVDDLFTRRMRKYWQVDAMTTIASSAFTSRRAIIAYWVTSALVVFELTLGGAW
ncbi:MAG: hypothetical protein JO108_03615, partial [Acidobacteriaceae bacterium]|nr:hypothetical protein [Acidobacteriaceae bacterium]